MDLEQANKQLLQAVIEPMESDQIQKIETACAAGADPNAYCSSTSSSRGKVLEGRTLLTHAIHDWSTEVVEKLLQCGADPNLTDKLGWTPWMTSLLTEESERDQIQDNLNQYGVKKGGEYIRDLIYAIYDGDIEKAITCFTSKKDLDLISTFRVDLVRHNIKNKNIEILKLLIERGLKPDMSHLYWAIRNNFSNAIELFLQHGAPIENKEKSLLMTAAATGKMELVKQLVNAGADVNRNDGDNIEHTAAFIARLNGHKDVAKWLTSKMDKELLEKLKRIVDSHNPKFKLLYDNGTSSEELSTDELVQILEGWDKEYELEVCNAGSDSITLKLSSLPDDLEKFYLEVEKLCPEIMDDKRFFLNQLKKRKMMDLWWD